MWSAYICDTMTGLLRSPIDIPSFSWSMSISDSSLSTTRDKGTGEGEASSITVPWSAVPADTPAERESILSADRRAIALFWRTGEDGDGMGVPILFGAIGQRTDSAVDTTFSMSSVLSILDSRIAVREGAYGRGGVTRDTLSYTGLSFRAIASALGQLCTGQKPGGSLPIDWAYSGEAGTHDRTYNSYDCGNNSCKRLLDNLTNVQGGPDMQFRPYLADSQHVRISFLAGSDADIYLGQDTVHRLSWFPGGGDIDNLTVDRLGAISRYYGSGAGSEAEQLAYLAQDTTLQSIRDPYPLMEAVYSATDDESMPVLKGHTDAMLDANKRPLMQIKGEINANDAAIPLGQIWPGQVVELAIDGFPTLADGVYTTRLMQMTGSESATIELTFDVMQATIF